MEKVRTMLYGDHDPYAKLKKMPLDMQGWLTSDSPVFAKLIEEAKPKLIVEVGTWKGRSAVHMAKECLKYTDDFEIVCIDTWLGSVEHWTGVDTNLTLENFKNGRPNIYEQFLSNVVHNDLEKYITPFPIDSVNGALTLQRLGIEADIIYIDAGHEYLSVKCDLYEYSKVVRAGGCILGDDFFHGPVASAAYDTFGDDKVISLTKDKFLWIR